MRVLLIYPQYTHSTKFDFRSPPMSLVYLASTLERHGHKVSVYDASLGPIVKTGKVFRYGIPDREMHDFLSTSNFDLIGIACSFTARWKFAKRIAQQAKKLRPSAYVVIGGLFPTSQWEYCLNDCSAVDSVMLGEAELSFSEVVNNLEAGCNINDACKDVKGVAWRVQERLFCNTKEKYNDKLDDLPYPAWHLVDLKKYFLFQRNIFELPAPCLPILSSRSCSNHCRFCNMYITHGSRWRVRSSDNVLDEIEYLMKRFGVHRFYFIDDNFSLDLERAKRVCRGILERKLNIKYNFFNGLSIKTVDYELVRLMKESGCSSVCLAIESGSDRIRNEIYGKNLDRKKIFEVFNLFHKIGIPTIAYFIVGAPGEKGSDLEETKKLLARLPMNLMTVNIFTPYPGTPLYDECKKKGWLMEPSIEDENRVEMFSPMLKTPDFEPREVTRWQRDLYLSFIRYHWPTLIKEALRPGGLVNIDMLGKFFGFLKFYHTSRTGSYEVSQEGFLK